MLKAKKAQHRRSGGTDDLSGSDIRESMSCAPISVSGARDYDVAHAGREAR